MFRKDHDEKTKRLANFLNDFYRVKYILLGGTVQRGFLLLSIAAFVQMEFCTARDIVANSELFRRKRESVFIRMVGNELNKFWQRL